MNEEEKALTYCTPAVKDGAAPDAVAVVVVLGQTLPRL